MVKLDDSSDKIAEMTLRLLEAQAFSTVLQSQLSQSTSEAEAIGLGLREELRQTAAKLHQANIQLATLRADAEAREHELYVAKQALEGRVQELAETVSEMEREREATKSENAETVRGFQHELDTRRAETSQALTELEKERETLKAESAKAASEYEHQRDALLAEIAKLGAEFEQERNALAEASAKAALEFEQERDALLAETAKTIAELEQERDALTEASAKAASEFEQERAALLAETAKTIAELEQERDRLKDDMNATQLQLAELREIFDLAKAKGDKSSELAAELESAQEQLKAIDQKVALNLPLVDKQTSLSSVHAAFDLVSDELFDLIESLERDLNRPISRNLSNERKPLEASLRYLKRLQAELANRLLENQDRAHELKARLDAQIVQTSAANQIARQLEGTILSQANENGRLAMQLARQSDALSIAQSALAASQNEQRRLVIELELSVRRAEAAASARSAPSATEKQQVKQRQLDALQLQLKQAEMRSSTYTHQINELQNSLSRALHDIEIQQLELGTLREKVAPAPTRPTADDLASIERITQLEASLAQATARLESVPWGTVEMFRLFQRWVPSRVQSLLRRLRKV